MADPKKITLGIFDAKKDAVFAAGTVAANTVLVEIDADAPQLDVVNALQKCIELVIEQEY